ncbi:SDR family NAD(P)-dependent oxidoreductase [Oceanibacterium hippocampi]|uniref:2-dehydro-3-deoxy-D-gluconate 5-dehydrogenase n=1 Tax=Oceanibacterium hippocampi TaxID=745714 RepID=A0A1Y5SJV0_9PROT|nr:SDR family oxidoreductase [Oceanibacterium hippocampi]SLN42367.1 2-dehydro-3-deoxy-D-gluconate 5-dehydrogenase [Oceanibacterium hippocampi]
MTSQQLPEHDLTGRTCLVIGGAQGIGAAIAIALARAGGSLVIAGRHHDRLAATASAIEASGGKVTRAVVDVADVDSIGALAAGLGEQGLSPSILVNCAGLGGMGSAFEVTPEQWDGIHDVHLRGTFFACQAFGRRMADDGYGKIINLSSTWATTVGVGRSVYCAAKAGVSHLTAALATEWAPHGIRVNALAPTATLTPTIEQRLKEHPEREAYLRDRIPLGRLALPEDIAGGAVFLASPASDFVTGHTLDIDGGWRFSK